MNKILNIIGLISGTSMDGIDVSLIQGNQKEIKSPNQNFYLPYCKDFQQKT